MTLRPGLLGAVAAVAALVLSTGCLTADEREFRLRLAAGCPTEKACVALQQEAAARNQKCQTYDANHPPMDAKDCAPYEDDAKTANRLLEDMEDKKKQDAEDKAAAEQAAAAEDARVSALGDSCQGLAAIEDAAAHATPPRDAQYRDMERTRREAKVVAFSGQIDQLLQAKPDLSDVATARAWVTQQASAAHAVVEQMRCYDGDAATRRQTQIDAWVASTGDVIDKEEACRAAPKCMADRDLAPKLCEAIQNRHVPADDAAIAKLRAQYKTAAHVAFDDKSCQKPQ